MLHLHRECTGTPSLHFCVDLAPPSGVHWHLPYKKAGSGKEDQASDTPISRSAFPLEGSSRRTRGPRTSLRLFSGPDPRSISSSRGSISAGVRTGRARRRRAPGPDEQALGQLPSFFLGDGMLIFCGSSPLSFSQIRKTGWKEVLAFLFSSH